MNRNKEVQPWLNVQSVIKAYTSVMLSVIHIEDLTNNGNLTLEQLELLLMVKAKKLTYAPSVFVQAKSNVRR